jgi:predicted transposase/invertase (TIGR01784 family)
MGKKLQLDPAMAESLPGTQEHQQKVQWYLDHREELSRFMDIRVDYAFKYIFGHKEVLLKLLNDILPIKVSDIEYKPNELPVQSEKDKRSMFDVICTERYSGKKFLCEMQQLEDTDMDDRLIFYGCSLVHIQIERGNPEYKLKPVYVICIANYARKHKKPVPAGKIMFNYRLREPQINDDFGDRLNFYILELPRLKKMWELLDTNVERWCYLFNNLSNFAEVPTNSEHFNELFEVARTRGLDDVQLKSYLDSMVTEYDKRVIGEYFLREGLEKGEKNTTVKHVKGMLAEGISVEAISRITGLNCEEITVIENGAANAF